MLKTIAKIKRTIKALKILAIVIVLGIIFSMSGWLLWQFFSADEVVAVVDNTKYSNEGILKVEIKNQSGESICFSSQFPYFLEKREKLRWNRYEYSETEAKDLIIRCLEPGEAKTFELTLYGGEGVHRLAIPLCLNCEIGEEFRQIDSVYSSNFVIN